MRKFKVEGGGLDVHQPAKVPQIVEDLRNAIMAGQYPPSAKLPSTSQLVRRYTVTRATVQRAIDQLKAEGLVYGEKGRGVFVRPLPPVVLTSTAASYWARRSTGESNWNAEVRAQGRTPKQEILGVVHEPASAEIASRLGIDEGARVLVRRLRFLADGQPMQLCTCYYPAALVDGTKITQPTPIRGGVHSVLEPIAGPWLRFVEDIYVRMPTPDELRQLQLGPGIPVVRSLRTLITATERSVEVIDELRPADRYRFRYAIDLTPPPPA